MNTPMHRNYKLCPFPQGPCNCEQIGNYYRSIASKGGQASTHRKARTAKRNIKIATRARQTCENGLTTAQAAKRLHVHRKTVQLWVLSGKLLASKVRGTWCITEAALKNFIESQK